MNNLNLLVSFLLSLGLIACGGDEGGDGPGVVAPANLQITVTPSENLQGQIEVVATADNTNYYDFDFGDGKQSQPIVENDGTINYTYNQEGDYTITVRAFATSDVFITGTQTVTITIDPAGIPGGYTSPESYSGYSLVWRDEFEGNGLSSDWTHEIGTGNSGWGNNELQYYREQNTTVTDGYLFITAKKEAFNGQQYTSSRIITKGKRFFKYGRIDIRAVLPKGQGIWPALWMLGENISTVSWPACGEIDIMEMVGGSALNERTTHGTVHWEDNGHQYQGGSYSLSSGSLADEFHVYSIIWDENQIRWYFDDNLFHSQSITSAAMAEFRENFFFIMNIAVGGNWPGSPNDNTQFPQQMIVDYVRVFQPN